MSAPSEAMPVPRRGSLLGSAATYTVANVLNAAIPFLLLPILTRVLTPADYGLVAMFATVLAVSSALTGVNVHGAVGVRYFQQDRFDLPRYVATCLTILVGTTALSALVAGALAGPLTRVTGLPLSWLVVAVIASGAQFVVQTRLVLWQVRDEPLKFAALQLFSSVLNVTLSLLFVLQLHWAWVGRTAGQSLAIVIAAAVAFASLRAGGWLRGRPNREYAVDAVRFGLPLVPHAIGSVLGVMVDRFLVTAVLGVSQTGIYLVGVQVAMGLTLVTESFNRAFVPWLYRALQSGDDARKAQIVRGTYLYFGVVLLGAVVLGVGGPPALELLVGPEFRESGTLLLTLAIGTAFGGMYYMVTNYLFYTGRTEMLAVVTLTAGLLNIAVGYVLIRHNGLIGAAQGFAITQATVFFGTWAAAQRAYPMPWLRALRRR